MSDIQKTIFRMTSSSNSLLAELAEENSASARDTRGDPSLHYDWNDLTASDALSTRINAMRRYFYKQEDRGAAGAGGAAPADSNDDRGRQQLMVVPPPSQPKWAASLSAPKAAADGDDAVISVNPEELKARHALTVAAAASSSSSSTALRQGGGGGAKPLYHSPKQWKIAKVLTGHEGWVWCVAVEPGNEWFATGGFDAVIKVWDLTTGALKANLTGHKEAVRSIALSARSPYMFSGSDDHAIRCWDLERSECTHEFFGHKKSVHAVATHPSMDVVLSAGGDKSVRVWDIRTGSEVHTMVGHTDSVMCVAAQQTEPQVMSGGSDGMIFLWDIRSGRALTRLTRHKRPVRGLVISADGSQLVSCGADDIRVWSLPSGEYLCSTSTIEDFVPEAADAAAEAQRHRSKKRRTGAQEEVSYRWSCCAVSRRNVVAVGSQDGQLALYDWARPQASPARLFYAPYQITKTKDLPGTQSGEGGITQVAFDISGTRLITTETDKSIKIWKPRE